MFETLLGNDLCNFETTKWSFSDRKYMYARKMPIYEVIFDRVYASNESIVLIKNNDRVL